MVYTKNKTNNSKKKKKKKILQSTKSLTEKHLALPHPTEPYWVRPHGPDRKEENSI